MQHPTHRRRIARVATPVLGVIGALGVLVGCSAGGEPDAPVPAGVPTSAILSPETALVVGDGSVRIEGFDSDGALTTTPGEFSWVSPAGGWNIAGGVVAVTPSVGTQADLAVTRVGTTEGLIQVTMPVVVGNGGLVFRYLDPDNHWVLVAAPQFAAWNLAKVVDGVRTIVTHAELSPVDPHTTVGVLLDDNDITVLVNGRPAAMASDPEHVDGDEAGLYVSGPQAADARWDDFVVLGVGVTPRPSP